MCDSRCGSELGRGCDSGRGSGSGSGRDSGRGSGCGRRWNLWFTLVNGHLNLCIFGSGCGSRCGSRCNLLFVVILEVWRFTLVIEHFNWCYFFAVGVAWEWVW